jgi:hypothetical protein
MRGRTMIEVKTWKWIGVALLLSLFFFFFSFPPEAFSQKAETKPPAAPEQKKLTLVDAEMCEGVTEHGPLNRSVAISASLGQAWCFTSFDPVPEDTYIYHKWFLREKLIYKIRLTLATPRWSTFSRIRLRSSDKGPWRVEISDREGKILAVLRFSIVE